MCICRNIFLPKTRRSEASPRFARGVVLTGRRKRLTHFLPFSPDIVSQTCQYALMMYMNTPRIIYTFLFLCSNEDITFCFYKIKKYLQQVLYTILNIFLVNITPSFLFKNTIGLFILIKNFTVFSLCELQSQPFH